MSVRFPAGVLPVDLDWTAVEALCHRYALGVAEIDRQHRMLFAWYVAMRDDPDSLQVVEGLIAYAARHFDYEEDWAASLGVDIAIHHDLHHELLRRLGELLYECDRAKVASIVSEWIVTHIDRDDRALIGRCATG